MGLLLASEGVEGHVCVSVLLVQEFVIGAGSGKFRSVATWAAIGDTVAPRHPSNPGLVELGSEPGT